MCIILLWNHNLNYCMNISLSKEDSLKVNFDCILVSLSQVKIYLEIFKKKKQSISVKIHLYRSTIRRNFDFAFWSAITNSILLLSEPIAWWAFWVPFRDLQKILLISGIFIDVWYRCMNFIRRARLIISSWDMSPTNITTIRSQSPLLYWHFSVSTHSWQENISSRHDKLTINVWNLIM
jgi:hypothetical protein